MHVTENRPYLSGNFKSYRLAENLFSFTNAFSHSQDRANSALLRILCIAVLQSLRNLSQILSTMNKRKELEQLCSILYMWFWLILNKLQLAEVT